MLGVAVRIVVAIVAGFLSCAGQAQIGIAEQAAKRAALAAAAAATGTTAPVSATAPPRPGITEIDPARLPPDGQRAFQLRAAALQMTAVLPDSYPQMEVRADNKVKRQPKGCPLQKHVMGIRWEPGSWTGITSYMGEAVNCVPQGVGTLTWSDGKVWTGEVMDVVTLVRPQQQGKFVLPMPRGLGVMTPLDGKVSTSISRARARQAGDPPICTNCVLLNSFGSNATPDEVYPHLEPLVIFDVTDPRNFFVGLDGQGNGTGSFNLVDGTTFTGDFVNGQPKPGEILTRTSPDGTKLVSSFKDWLPDLGELVILRKPNGDRLSGRILQVQDKSPTGVTYLSGRVEENLKEPDAELGLAAGDYWINHGFRDGKVIRTLIAPIGEALFKGGPQREGCLKPTFLPPDFTTFWPACQPEGRVGANGEPTTAGTVSFSRNSQERILERFDGVGFRFAWITEDAKGNLVRRIFADGFVTDPVLGPVGKAQIDGRGGGFKGEFLGLVPDGPGTCYVPAEKVEEPCFYVNGARTDEIHLARQEAKIAARAAKREADALAAQQAEEQRLLQQAESQAREAQQAAQYAADEAQRAARRAAYDDDDGAPQGNPIMDVMNDLSGKFRAAAVENQQGWDRVNEINAAQQRAADARAAARQAENARIAQANAAAAEQRAAQTRNAQAITAAEIQRRQAEAQQRVAEARQRAIAQQQTQAQSAQSRAATATQTTPSSSSNAGINGSPQTYANAESGFATGSTPVRSNRQSSPVSNSGPSGGSVCSGDADMNDYRRLMGASGIKRVAYERCEGQNYINLKKSRAETARICAPQQAEWDRAVAATRAHPCDAVGKGPRRASSQ